ncbi:class I SAM-dependent methyltransferase [Rhodococcus zopfii]|uniref:class I SAM-dependent methyltransferase n=1 Tax=Rhodococcus zopfii TaxID=43772 RepID=UPI00111125DC|nr:class I SAM-dependent methyltransferase [Rhodococcus zopfii]
MTTSLVYRNGTVYGLVMRMLYGRHYAARFRAVDSEIPSGACVLDLCCGPATLYTRYLRDRDVDYRGLDLNEQFVAEVRHAGGRADVWDLHAGNPLPPADVVLMQASLYHFLPDPSPVLDRMLAAAREKVIVAEPIRNFASSDNRVLATLGRRYTDPGDGTRSHRFTEETLDALFAGYADRVRKQTLIAGGREKLYVLTP